LDLAEISKYWRFSALSARCPEEWISQLTLSVESDISSLDLSLLYTSAFSLPHGNATHLDIDLVSTKDNRDVLTNPLQISVPVRNVLVGDSGSNIKHDDTTLSLDIVSISETTEFLLSSGIPDIETDGTKVGVESQWVDLDTEGGCFC
jgi:hypothetical protein